ncbi:hypothetical protein BR1R3_06710 [Pseudomonas atacamensis]|nr:hypothetical protein BR1R3_06710 [Pseudomonas atacamensis]
MIREEAKIVAPHPSPLPRERAPTCVIFKPEFGSVFQVGVYLESPSVSPLSLRERVRVRANSYPPQAEGCNAAIMSTSIAAFFGN